MIAVSCILACWYCLHKEVEGMQKAGGGKPSTKRERSLQRLIKIPTIKKTIIEWLLCTRNNSSNKNVHRNTGEKRLDWKGE